MATATLSRSSAIPRTREERPARRKKEARTDIWSSLLRQTREAQARSRTHAVQARELIVCGGSADDQRAFVQTIARPPPAQSSSKAIRDPREKRQRGEVVLSNRFAYGYGHVTIFSPPTHGGGLLGNDSDEIARLGIHTVPEPDQGYEETLRRLLQPQKKPDNTDGESGEVREEGNADVAREPERHPSVVLLLSWKQPWKFLDLLRRWLQLLARALLQADSPQENPIDVLKEYQLGITVVLQHVETQEQLERENYKEEIFDYISQCLRTCLLPLSAALIYTPSAPPAPINPQAAPLSEVQKVIYTSLGLDLSNLSPSVAKSSSASGTKKEDLSPKHNVVDRMAIIVPQGWDSVGKIRLLSETFSPEAIMDGWMSDINTPVYIAAPVSPELDGKDQADSSANRTLETSSGESTEKVTYEAAGASSPVEPLPDHDYPVSPSKLTRSAILAYESSVQDPKAHKIPQAPRVDVTTKPEQQFLAEMRTQLQMLEDRDRERQRREPGAIATASTTGGGRGMAIPSGESSGALNNLGDVQFNVGGVNYNAATAEAAIERLKRSSVPESPRTGTPRPPKREERDGSRETPRAADLDTDKLEEYFHSLMKRSGGSTGSGQSTPSKQTGR